MKGHGKTREEYFISAGEREGLLRELDKFIQDNAPDLKPYLSGGSGMTGSMLGYGAIQYQSKSMKEPMDWPLVAVANQKNYISLYVCVADKDGYMAEKKADKLGKVSVGRSCIRFKKSEDLNRNTFKSMLQEINRRYKAGENLFGF